MADSTARFRSLVTVETVSLCHLVLSLFGSLAGISYNVPLFFFGLYASQNDQTTRPLKMFFGLLLLSIILDITWMGVYGVGMPGLYQFSLSMNIISLIFKVPTAFLTLVSMRSREGYSTTFSGFNNSGYAGFTNPPPQQHHQTPVASEAPAYGGHPDEKPVDPSQSTSQGGYQQL